MKKLTREVVLATERNGLFCDVGDGERELEVGDSRFTADGDDGTCIVEPARGITVVTNQKSVMTEYWSMWGKRDRQVCRKGETRSV